MTRLVSARRCLICNPVVSARSARGISLISYVLETLAYAITLAYSYRNEFPFSTYGENLFLTLQNAVITLLIIHYPASRQLTRPPSSAPRVASAALLMVLLAAAFIYVPKAALTPLQIATLPLSLFSKFPQIRQNYRSKSTGQLSAFAVIAQVGGCLARLFTTAAEIGDPIVSAGFALALALNLVLGVQMWIYWGQEEKDDYDRVPIAMSTATPVALDEKRQWSPAPSPLPTSARVEVVVPPQSPRVGGARKWARKVD